MSKLKVFIVGAVVCAIVLFFFGLDQSVRGASLARGKNQLLVAYDAFTKTGTITNYATSGHQVYLSTNVVTIDGGQHRCFVEVGLDSDSGKLAMTTNKIFIWLDPVRPPKIITNGYKPPLFLKRFLEGLV